MKKQKIELAKCKEISYEPGSFELTQGVRHDDSRETYDSRFSSRGYGWGQYAESAKLIVLANIDSAPDPQENYEIWVDRYFRDKVGNLTKGRREVIIETMPRLIGVTRHERSDKSLYFKPTDYSLNSWLLNACYAQTCKKGKKHGFMDLNLFLTEAKEVQNDALGPFTVKYC